MTSSAATPSGSSKYVSSVNFPVGIGAAGFDSSLGIATSAGYGDGKGCFTVSIFLQVLHHKFSTHDRENENLPCACLREINTFKNNPKLLLHV